MILSTKVKVVYTSILKYCFVFVTLLENHALLGAGFQYPYVTCGSSLKLFNTVSRVRLHSHDVKYGSGSGQQSVTAVSSSGDHNSYWQIKPKIGEKCSRGEPVRCGQSVRFMHLNTKKNLHSHHYTSPLSHNVEVSAFGEDGVGDSGDDWVVLCDGSFWSRSDKVRIRHVVTDSYLHVTGDEFGRPIHGQKEVCGYSYANEQNLWKAGEGVFLHPNEQQVKHDEL